MCQNKELNYLVEMINEQIYPYTITEGYKENLSEWIQKFDYEILVESVETGVRAYLEYDKTGNATGESTDNFLKKLGGIAYNNTLPPVDKEIRHLISKCRKKFYYWDDNKANELFDRYKVVLYHAGYDDDMIIEELQTSVDRFYKVSRYWDEWFEHMTTRIQTIQKTECLDDVEIYHNETVLSMEIINGLPKAFKRMSEQINACYENNLYDCAAMMMCRLIEHLLFVYYAILESEPNDFSIDNLESITKAIDFARTEPSVELSMDTKNNLLLFEELGSVSVDTFNDNLLIDDIEPHIEKYRAVIEELIEKSKIKPNTLFEWSSGSSHEKGCEHSHTASF